MYKIKRAVIRLMALCMVTMLLTGCGDKKEKVRIGTGNESGNYYSYAMNLSDKVPDDADYQVTVKSTAGSQANLRLISDGYLEMALVQSDALADALAGEGAFDEPLTGFHTVSGLYKESCQLVVRADSDIKSVYDLKGKKVSLGEEDSGVLKNAGDILRCADIDSKDFEAFYYSYSDSAKALADGELDAFFVTASYPTTAIVDINSDAGVRIVPLDAAIVRRLLKDDAYSSITIPAGTYEGQEEDVETICVTAVLIASDDLDKNIEEAILGILKDNGDELNEISFGVKAKEDEKGTPIIDMDMYMTLALAVAVLYLGAFLRKRIKFLTTFCIPAPVIGGLIFAILSCVLYVFGIVEFRFDETLKTVCMVMFFTSVGFQANLKVLKSGGKGLIVFLICVVALIFMQNGMAVALANLLGVDKLVGLCTGSIPMVGGHGTAGAFGLVLEDLGLDGATTLCTAAATFGLVFGSLMGGPVGRRLILKHDLLKTAEQEDDTVLVEDEKKHRRHVSMYAPAAYQLAIAMGLGTIVSMQLSKTGMTFPIYIGAMIVAAFMRNIGEYSGKFTIHMGEINDLGGICLSLFLGIAMVTLKLWQLAELALPLFVLLAAQTLLMFLFAYFVIFNVMGRNYDAAVLSAGTCGFGMGATPNAMANMQAVTERYVPSIKAYLLVPIVGSMFADFLNSLIITFFINLL